MESDIKCLFEEGFVPAPGEADAAFYLRVKKTKEKWLSPEKIHEFPIETTTPPFIFRSNKKLPFWVGGMTWILTFDDGCKIPFIQLPKTLRRYTFTKEEEILAHERVHALRVAFNEPIFEEILAYQSSPSKFRRFFGPLCATTKETSLVMGSFLVGIVPYCFWISPLVICTLLIRLFKRQRLLKRAKLALQKRLKHPEIAILLLSDPEILQAANNQLDFLDQKEIRIRQILLLDTSQ